MNITQKQTILNEIETIQGFDFDQMLLSQYTEKTELNSVMFGKHNALDFKSLLNKTVLQLKNELTNGFGLMLPNQENFYNDFGSVTLDSDIQNLRAYISNPNNGDNAAEILDRLMYYQIRQGFWDRSKIKLHDVNTDKINSAQEQLELAQKNLSENLKTFGKLKGSFDEKLEEINTFFTTKKQEMTEVATLLSEATTSNTKITELGALSSNKDTEIDGILKNIKDKVTSVSESITQYETDFTAIKKDNSTLKLQLETSIGKATEDLKKSKEGIEFIESNREEIVRLTGMAADGSLGSKFNQRQEILDKGLTFWKWAVPIMTILAGAWVVIVFKYLLPTFKEEWINILISILKTSPGFILLGFVFSQYKKERNLQEEYAFKSAVAMTLTAYSEMLSDADAENNISRQQMLLKSIEMVYNQPHIHPVKSETLFSFNTKDLKETVGTLTDAVKNIKSN